MSTSRFFSFFMIFILIISSTACVVAPNTPGNIDTGPNTPADTDTDPQETPTSQQPTTIPINESNPSSSLPRVSSDVPPSEFLELTDGMNDFAITLLQEINSNSAENLIFSPYSISLALAMAYAGSGGKTAEEMAQVLIFDLSQEELHGRLNGLDQSLYVVPAHLEDQKDSFQLNIANSLWAQSGYPFRQSYFDLLAQSYGTGLQVVDFAHDSEQVRGQINKWVIDETEGKIKDLIPPGGLDSLTRLVITNAIYFNAAWLNQFSKEETRPDDFYLNTTSTVKAQMMQIELGFKYQRNQDIQLVEIPYLNDRYSMVLLMPLETDLPAFITGLNNDQINSWLENTRSGEVVLRMPKFKFESSFSVNQALQALGMETAFSPTEADFSGMYQPDGDRLYISEVIHKAFVDVDEEGTEAAAATAIVMGVTVAQPIEEPVLLEFNHPFLFLIRDRQSGLNLFIGMMMDPTG